MIRPSAHSSGPDAANGQANLVLIVDDSRAQRFLLQRHLQSWGYRTVEALSGEEALARCAQQDFDLILSDWMMPGMNGLEFCRAFRELKRDFYSYFILLTSKNDKQAVSEALDMGADDFLSKPIAPSELRARIAAGERLLRMERELRTRNATLQTTLAELQGLYDALDRDLFQARKLQQSLLRERHHVLANSQLSLTLRASGHVGGDLVGLFPIAPHRIGLFSFDVSGHGVAAAMLSARVGGLFTGAQSQNIALTRAPATGRLIARPPAAVAARLNRLMLREIDTETYLTLAYADIDLCTGRAAMVQAGHPHPVLQHQSGEVTFLGAGGLPIGLLEDAPFKGFETQLSPGDRLFLYSDGITECTNRAGEEFGHEGLAALMQRLHGLSGPEFLDAFIWELANWAGTDEFEDDISAALLEFNDYAKDGTNPMKEAPANTAVPVPG